MAIIDYSNSLEKEICEVLGLKNIISLKLILAKDSLTTIETIFYIETKPLEKIKQILKRYRLEEIKPIVETHFNAQTEGKKLETI